MLLCLNFKVSISYLPGICKGRGETGLAIFNTECYHKGVFIQDVFFLREASGENFRFSPLPVPIIATDSDDLTLKQGEHKKSAPWGGFFGLCYFGTRM